MRAERRAVNAAGSRCSRPPTKATKLLLSYAKLCLFPASEHDRGLVSLLNKPFCRQPLHLPDRDQFYALNQGMVACMLYQCRYRCRLEGAT